MDLNTKISVSKVIQRIQGVPYPHEVFPCLDTQYSKFSNENYVASRWESPTIDDIISERKAQIDDINTVIQQVAIVLEQFREQRKRTVSSLTIHEGFISCIRRLPSDVLEDIFVHCLPPETYNKPTVQAAPLLLTGICRSWREVALNTSKLWSSLVIQLQPEQLPCCDGWLKKAKGFPLSLNVQIPSRPVPANAVLDLLQVYASQLKNLNIYLSGACEIDRSPLVSDVPILERLSLIGAIDGLILSQAFSIAQPQPRLHTLSIHTWSDMTRFPAFNPGWTNITRLSLVLRPSSYGYCGRGPAFLMVLQTFPNLDHLVFCPVQFFFGDGSAPFTHPKLRLLHIVVDVDWRGSPLHTLTLPNLRYLHVCHSPDPGPARPLPARVFALKYPLREDRPHRIIANSCYNTNELFTVLNPGWTSITHIWLQARTRSRFLFHVLALCPNLEDVVISLMVPGYVGTDLPQGSSATGSHPILHSLNIRNVEGRFCDLLHGLTLPSLTHFGISSRENKSWPHEEFESFLSRSQCPLETLNIKWPRTGIEQREEFGSLTPTLMHVNLRDVEGPFYSWSR